MKTARELYLPEHGSPHWLPGGSPPGGLLYLAWGRRFYGRHPIPLRLHHGWTYMAILSGQPVLLVGEKRLAMKRGSLIVAGPDAAYGWIDRPAARSSLLVWCWSQPPQIGTRLHTKTCWLRTADDEGLAELEDLHNRTRREIQSPDEFSPVALTSLKNLVDAELARRGGHPERVAKRDAHRLQLAGQWMRRHLDIRAPAGALADYLGLSPMGLQRLFRQSTGRSPGRAFLEVKMEQAARRLAEPGVAVKQVAFALGYRHPGDFTRAYTRFHGHPPSGRPGRRAKELQA